VPGTTVKPWHTIHCARTRVTTSGNTIHVDAGTYAESDSSALAVGVSLPGDAMATSIVKASVTSGAAGAWSITSTFTKFGYFTPASCIPK
jgi:hypothetical protein